MFRNRFLSLFLVLTLLTALFAGCFTVSAAGNTKNTGTRHELCEALSSQAVAYYTGSNTWEALSALDGKQTTSSQEACGSPLFNALHSLMYGTLTNTVTYKSLTSYWQSTDASGGSNDACLIYADEISSSYNREHVWPKSHGNFYESGAGSDLHHLRPSDTTINSTRNHWTYGNVKELCSSYSTAEYDGETVLWYNTSYSGNDCLGLVEVKDNVKGDIARIILYVYVTYGNSSGENLNLCTKTSSSGSGNNANTGDKIIYDLATLLEWCESDPVDTWEMSRNDCCANIQGNRNVFIDYPEFAWLLFGQDVPDMDTPSGMAHEMQDDSGYTVTAVSADTSMGTVSGSGRYFTATPTEGYCVTGYTLTPEGAATVTQNGNQFIVTKPTQDCTLTVYFAPKSPVTLTFSVPAGVSCEAISGYMGETVTLPTPNGKPSGAYEYSFKGWVVSQVDNSTDKPMELLTAGSEYTPTASTCFYALYTYNIGGSGSSETFTRISSEDELKDGASYVFTSTYTGKAMTTEVSGNWVYPGSTYSTTSDTIENPAANEIWTVSNGIISSSAGSLICGGAKSISLSDAGSTWTMTSSNGLWTLEASNCILCFNSSGWRPYSGSGYGNDKTLYIYRAGDGGTTYYTTVISGECEHNYVPVVTNPTCISGGFTTYTCSKCGAFYTAEETAALGHNYTVQTVPPTTTEKGYDLHTCTRCGDTYKDNFVLPADPFCSHKNTEVQNAVPASCTTDGYTGDTYCKDCDKVIAEGSVIPALGHDLIAHEAKPASCTTAGYEAYDTCSRCDYTTYTEIPALGHDFVDGHCTRCGVEDPDYNPTCEHSNLERRNGSDPDCTTEGYTGDVYCTDCGALLERGEPIAALGHDWDEGEAAPITANPTCGVSVSVLYTCKRCQATKTEERPADPCPTKDYTDVEYTWYHDAVDFVVAEGLMGSTKTDTLTFEPKTKVSRAMVASILYRMADTPDVEYQGTFSDVPAGKWYSNAVEWCAQKGLASGKGNGKFDPNGNVTRQELAVFMKKMAEYLEEDTTATAELSTFADAEKVPSWARDYVSWAVAAGLISGKASNGQTYLAPADNATRAELAVILRNFLKNISIE